MITILQTIIGMVIALLSGAWLGYDYGTDKFQAAVDSQLVRDLKAAQDQTATLQAKVDTALEQKAKDDDAIKTLGRNNSGLARRLRNAPTAASVSGNTSNALADEYADAERDIGRCADGVDRFSREAAQEAGKTRALKSAWPGRESARKARESRTIN